MWDNISVPWEKKKKQCLFPAVYTAQVQQALNGKALSLQTPEKSFPRSTLIFNVLSVFYLLGTLINRMITEQIDSVLFVWSVGVKLHSNKDIQFRDQFILS